MFALNFEQNVKVTRTKPCAFGSRLTFFPFAILFILARPTGLTISAVSTFFTIQFTIDVQKLCLAATDRKNLESLLRIVFQNAV